MFRAEGGIARVSRLYLQVIAQNRPESRLELVVLNDEYIPPEGLVRYAASRAHAVPCARNKWRCFKAVWNATRDTETEVTCTHVHLAPLLWIAQRLGRRLIYDVVVHGIEVWKPLTILQQYSLTRSRRILSISEYTRRDILKRSPHLDSQIVVIPNALDPSFAVGNDRPLPSEPFTILTVSRLAAHDHEKGIDHLIKAMPQIIKTHPKATLRIIGQGIDRKRLEELADASSAASHIQFLGFVPDEDLKKEFGRCTLFALPSKKEGFGLVYLEAMAAGKPCIAADAGGAPEVINEHSGMIVPYGEVTLLGEAVIQALSRPWDARKVQARSEEFSFPVFVDRWNAISAPTS